jgi:hypothetical protein
MTSTIERLHCVRQTGLDVHEVAVSPRPGNQQIATPARPRGPAVRLFSVRLGLGRRPQKWLYRRRLRPRATAANVCHYLGAEDRVIAGDGHCTSRRSTESS